MVLLLLPWLRLLLLLQCLTFSSFARFPFHDSQVLCWGVFGSKSAPRRPKSDSNFFFFGSKSLQERSKRLSRGFWMASASRMRSGTNFRPVLGPFLEAPDLQN